MIYLNNAGTTWPKPKSVYEAISNFSNLEPDEWPSIFDEGIMDIIRFLNIPASGSFLFTSSCTSALTLAMSDFEWNIGDRLLVSHMEHHALSRWLYKIQLTQGIQGIIVPRDNQSPIDLDKLEKELRDGAKLVAVSMASNVTGELLPFKEIIALAHRYGALCLLDGAQTTGVIPIDITTLDPDFFVFAGHKGPLAPQGIGGLYISERVRMACPSAACEINLEDKNSAILPNYCDAGSLNTMAVAGLSAGIKWLEMQGWDKIIHHRKMLISHLRKSLLTLNNITILGSGNVDSSTGTLALTHDSLTPNELSNILWKKHSIKVGTGFQCAPLAHETLGTAKDGCLRISVGPFNTMQEVDLLKETLISLT